MDETLSKLADLLPAKYQHTILLLLAASPYLTRSLYALMNGRGLKGLLASIWLGTNTPKQQETTTKDETNAK